MALALVTYTQSVSGNKNFTVPFPYISRDHVQVKVDGSAVSFTWNNASTVSLATAPAVGAKVEVRRITEKTNLLVDFKDGSTITETDLDTLARQTFFLSQESDDLAVESNTIANDAKTIAQSADSKANTAISTANSATTTANNASTTANNAATSASNAVTTANTALSTANAASTAASNAVTTANSAQTAANNAVTTANAATTTANSAASQAASAVTTANAAASDAATALNTANTALADSASAVSMANFASLKADAAESAAVSASQDAQSAAADAGTAVTTAQQLEVTVNQVLADVQAIAGGDLSDFAKNSENLALLADKAAARANLGLGNVNNTSDLDKPVSTATQAAIDSGLATKANVSHTHSKAEITDLSLTWNDVTGKPTTFSPSAHSHTIADVTGLQGALDGKAASSHTHAIADVTGLQGALDGKAASSHAHTWSQITDKPSTFPPSGHTHPLSQITGGTTYGQFVIGGTASDWSWPNGLEVRERSGLGTAVSAWQDAPRLTFHWGSRHVKNIGLRSDGLMAVNDDPIALYSNLAGKASTSGAMWMEHVWSGDYAGPIDLVANWGYAVYQVQFGAGIYLRNFIIVGSYEGPALTHNTDNRLSSSETALDYSVARMARSVSAVNNANWRIKNIWRFARSN